MDNYDRANRQINIYEAITIFTLYQFKLSAIEDYMSLGLDNVLDQLGTWQRFANCQSQLQISD